MRVAEALLVAGPLWLLVLQPFGWKRRTDPHRKEVPVMCRVCGHDLGSHSERMDCRTCKSEQRPYECGVDASRWGRR